MLLFSAKKFSFLNSICMFFYTFFSRNLITKEKIGDSGRVISCLCIIPVLFQNRGGSTPTVQMIFKLFCPEDNHSLYFCMCFKYRNPQVMMLGTSVHIFYFVSKLNYLLRLYIHFIVCRHHKPCRYLRFTRTITPFMAGYFTLNSNSITNF